MNKMYCLLLLAKILGIFGLEGLAALAADSDSQASVQGLQARWRWLALAPWRLQIVNLSAMAMNEEEMMDSMDEEEENDASKEEAEKDEEREDDEDQGQAGDGGGARKRRTRASFGIKVPRKEWPVIKQRKYKRRGRRGNKVQVRPGSKSDGAQSSISGSPYQSGIAQKKTT